MNQNIHILIVEDNRIFAESLEDMIDLSDQLTCTATYRSAEECITAIHAEEIPPADLLLLDLHLPGKSGLTLVPFIKQHLPECDILVLTQNDDYLTTLEAIKLGVSGYLLKESSIGEIREAIVDVHEGVGIIDPRLSRAFLSALGTKPLDKMNPLSPRERQVLELLAMGYVKKEVSDKLGISYSAVAQKTERIYKKLQVPNIAAAVATAIRKGLI